MSDLLELAERCEKAEGPDRELDRDIHCLAHGFEKRWNEKLEIWQCWRDNKWIGLGSIPAYTASIDAALTLVPEGCLFAVETLDGYPRAIVTGSDYSRAPTPALALCAAALRARHALSEGGE